MRDRNAPLTSADIASLDWAKSEGLVPAIVQDVETGQVLMLGYMNEESLAATLDTGFATFFSRSKNRLWQKGETSGNQLAVKAIYGDCDNDSLLVQAAPEGPICHLGTTSCFSDEAAGGAGFLATLGRIVGERATADPKESYTARLIGEGVKRIAQKVGEEGVEVALAASSGSEEECVNEVADLAYHLTVLMEARGLGWSDIVAKLRERHKA